MNREVLERCHFWFDKLGVTSDFVAPSDSILIVRVPDEVLYDGVLHICPSYATREQPVYRVGMACHSVLERFVGQRPYMFSAISKGTAFLYVSAHADKRFTYRSIEYIVYPRDHIAGRFVADEPRSYRSQPCDEVHYSGSWMI